MQIIIEFSTGMLNECMLVFGCVQCDGQLLATGSYDGYARIWNTEGIFFLLLSINFVLIIATHCCNIL